MGKTNEGGAIAVRATRRPAAMWPSLAGRTRDTSDGRLAP